VAGAAKSSFAGAQLRLAAAPRAVARRAPALAPIAELERLRLHNLTPEPGSRPKKSRVGRGHSAGQARGMLHPRHRGRAAPHGRAAPCRAARRRFVSYPARLRALLRHGSRCCAPTALSRRNPSQPGESLLASR
jgi:hypothetical protein